MNTLNLPEGTTATCEYCREEITLDVTEGGGDPAVFGAWDWGTRILSIGGFDYGCGDSPLTDEDGTGGHSPVWETISMKGIIEERLAYLRSQIEAECISYGELSELQDLAPHIDPGDVVLLQWAGVPEFPDEVTA